MRPMFQPDQISIHRIVAYNLHKGPALAVVTEVNAKGLRIMIKNRKEFPIKRNEVFACGPVVGSSLEGFVSALEEYEALSQQTSLETDAELLHQMLLEDPEKGYEFPELVALYFGKTTKISDALAMALVLERDSYYFKRKKDFWLPNSVEFIEQYRAQVKRMEERQKAQKQQVDFLNGLGPVNTEERESEFVKDLIELSGLWRNDLVDRYQDVLQQAGIKDRFLLRRFLVERSIVSCDYSFELLESGYPLKFSDNFLGYLKEYPKPKNEILMSQLKGFEDLRGITTYTVDSKSTKDRDDAISFTPDRGFMMHISLVSAFVNGDSRIEKEIEKRLTSIYLPELKLSMFPEETVVQDLSLDEGQDRFCLTVEFNFVESNLIYKVFPSLVHIDKNLSYSEMESAKDTQFLQFYEMAEKIKQWRITNGAVLFQGRDLEFELADEIELSSREITASMQVIAELSIAANYAFARFSEENSIPILYRTQNGSREEIAKSSFYQPVLNDFYTYYHLKKNFGRTSFDSHKKPHVSLGLSHYTQMTSPIRRYVDYLNQKQLYQHFLGQNPLNKEELDQHFMLLSGHLQEINSLQDKRKKHWLMRYINQEIEKQSGKPLISPATLLEVFEEDVLYYLEDFGMIFKGRRNHENMKNGDRIFMKITGVRLMDREIIGEFSLTKAEGKTSA